MELKGDGRHLWSMLLDGSSLRKYSLPPLHQVGYDSLAHDGMIIRQARSGSWPDCGLVLISASLIILFD